MEGAPACSGFEVRGHLVDVVDIEWQEDDLHLARIEPSPKLQNLGLGPSHLGLHRGALTPERRLASRSACDE